MLGLLDAVAAPGTAASAKTGAASRPGAASVPVTGDAVLAGVAVALARAGIEVTELALQLPSLDEVFHTLTTPGTATAVRPKELV